MYVFMWAKYDSQDKNNCIHNFRVLIVSHVKGFLKVKILSEIYEDFTSSFPRLVWQRI